MTPDSGVEGELAGEAGIMGIEEFIHNLKISMANRLSQAFTRSDQRLLQDSHTEEQILDLKKLRSKVVFFMVRICSLSELIQ